MAGLLRRNGKLPALPQRRNWPSPNAVKKFSAACTVTHATRNDTVMLPQCRVSLPRRQAVSLLTDHILMHGRVDPSEAERLQGAEQLRSPLLFLRLHIMVDILPTRSYSLIV